MDNRHTPAHRSNDRASSHAAHPSPYGRTHTREPRSIRFWRAIKVVATIAVIIAICAWLGLL